MYNETQNSSQNISPKPKNKILQIFIIVLLVILLLLSLFGFYYLYTNSSKIPSESKNISSQNNIEDVKSKSSEINNYSDPDFDLFFRYSNDLTVNAGNLEKISPKKEDLTEEKVGDYLSKIIQVTDSNGNKLTIVYSNSPIQCDKPYTLSELKESGKEVGDFAFASGKIYFYKNKYVLVTSLNGVEDLCSDKVSTNVDATLLMADGQNDTSAFDDLVLTIDDGTYRS